MPAARSAHPGGPETPGPNANAPEMELRLGKGCFQNLLHTTPASPRSFYFSQGDEKGREERAGPLPRARRRLPRCARCAAERGGRGGGLPRALRRAAGPTGEEAPAGGGWVPYGLPQLPLVVQLALQAARALLRGVRLLLQAPDFPPHRLQRAAPRHCAGWRRAGCGGRGRLLRSGCRCSSPERPAAPPRPRRQTAAPPAAQDPPGSRGLPGSAGKPQAGARVRGAGTTPGRGARRRPREFANRGRRCACPLQRGWPALGARCGAHGRLSPAGREAIARGISLPLPAPLPDSELSRSNGPGY